jgi:hypothetical protein
MMGAATAAAVAAFALVTQDTTPLRAAPQSQAAIHAQLLPGELVELRGRRQGFAQVWDHRRERGGYVRESQLRPLSTAEADAPELLAVLRHLRDTPGSETLGIAYVAAYLKAAPARRITAEPFDALGLMAERLARRANERQLEVAAAYGVKVVSIERDGALKLCYDGEAFQRVLNLPATPEQQARAVLALTRHDCVAPAPRPDQRLALDRGRAALLEQVDPAALADEALAQRLQVRRAGVWAALAHAQARRDETPQAAARQALAALAAVQSGALAEDDAPEYADAAMRVAGVRWAVAPPAAAGRLQVRTRAGEPGQTCVQLLDGARPLAERCTWGVVWAASARPRADGRALALAVQPLEGWSELWVWRQDAQGWSVDVLPPAVASPGLGYVEFAGWTAGPKRRLLIAREARAEGRLLRRFEVLDAQTLATERFASTPQLLAAFGSGADAEWKRGTVSLR